MSLESTRTTICNKLSEQFDAMLQPVTSTQTALKKQISTAKSQLRDLTFSPEATIDQAVEDLDNDIQDNIPQGDPEDVQEAVDFINECSFLSGDDLLSNPIALFNGAVDSTVNKSKELISNVASSIPEFEVAEILSEIQDKLSGVLEGLPSLPGSLNISDLVRQADELINCMAGRCGPDFSSRISNMTSQLQSIYDDLSLDDNPLSETWGELDLETIYNEAGVEAQDILKMDKAVDSVNKAKTDALGGISNLKSSIKSASETVTGLF